MLKIFAHFAHILVSGNSPLTDILNCRLSLLSGKFIASLLFYCGDNEAMLGLI